MCLNVYDQNLDHLGFDHLVGARWDQSERLRGSEWSTQPESTFFYFCLVVKVVFDLIVSVQGRIVTTLDLPGNKKAARSA